MAKDQLYREGLKVYTGESQDAGPGQGSPEPWTGGPGQKERGSKVLSNNFLRNRFLHTERKRWKKYHPIFRKIGAMVKGLVKKVDDGKSLVEIQIGNRLSVLPLKNMRWARVPNKESLLRRQNQKPSQALKAGDVVLVRIEKEYDSSKAGKEKPSKEPKGENRFTWEVSLEQIPADSGRPCLHGP